MLPAVAGKESPQLRTANGYFLFKTLHPVHLAGAAPSGAVDPVWTIVALAPDTALAALRDRVREKSIVLFSAACLVVAVLALVLSNSMENRRVAERAQAMYASAMQEMMDSMQRQAERDVQRHESDTSDPPD